MTPKRAFRSKIPAKFHEKIFEWYSCGMKIVCILTKLEKDFGYHTHNRTLTRLLAHLKTESLAQTSAIIAQQAQEQVIGDFEKLNKLYKEVANVAEIAKGSDHNLHLRAVDRLTKLLQIKFSINTKDDKTNVKEDDILEGLLSKLS